MNLKFDFKPLGVLAICLTMAANSLSAIMLQLTEVGSDVVGTYSGSLDISSLSFFATVPVSSFFTSTLSPAIGWSEVSATDPSSSDFYFLSGSTPGSGFTAQTVDLSSGGFGLRDNLIAVPAGYISGAPITASITLQGASFLSMGISLGDSGLISDLGAVGAVSWSAMPEPSSYGLIIGGAIFCIAVCRRSCRS